MSFTEFTKNDNKSIIWGLLQEGGVFNDIPNSSFENVKRIFESSIYSMKPEFDVFFENNDEGDDGYDNKASEMIMNSNKTVIKKMIQELGKFKVNRTPTENQNVQHTPTNILPVPPRYNSSTKKPKIEEIYRADDLQKSRMSEIEVRMKEKQEEMDSMLNNKKPVDIDFTDKKSGLSDTKLASSDMERLLAEALSSRQQELDQVNLNNEQHSLNKNINAEEWIKSTSTKPINTANTVNTSKEIKRPVESINKKSSIQETTDLTKKSVTFNDNENIKIRYENILDASGGLDATNDINNGVDNDGEIELSILSKLKRSNTKTANNAPTNNIIHNSNSLLYKPIPLDEFMDNDNDNSKNKYEDDGDGDGDEDGDDDSEVTNYKGSEYNLYPYSKKRFAGETGEYKKLEDKIIIIQNELESIKNMQEKILHILTNVNVDQKIDKL